MNLETVVKVNGKVRKVVGRNPNGSLNLDRGQVLYLDRSKEGRLHGRMVNGKFFSYHVNI